MYYFTFISTPINDNKFTCFFLQKYWNNELLRWNQSLYDGIKRTVVNSNDIWIPEIAMLNR